MENSSVFNGRLMIVVTSTSYRDTIHIGHTFRDFDMLILKNASMLLTYKVKGVPGVAGEPKLATRVEPASGPEGEVILPLGSVTSITVANEKAWAPFLGRANGREGEDEEGFGDAE